MRDELRQLLSFIPPPSSLMKKGRVIMPRAKRGNKRVERRKKILKLAKGYRGTKSKLYRSAKESVERGLAFAYTGRKLKKRDFRSLWIVRIGAAARLNGLNYSQFMHGL